MPSVTASDGPVAVTGASGYVGSHVVIALMKRGYTVHACVTDPNDPDKTGHLLALNGGDHPGHLEIHGANLLDAGGEARCARRARPASLRVEAGPRLGA